MSIAHDLRYAARGLVRAPALALAAIVTLALGIGANAAIFSVVRGTLLRPLPNQDEERLLYLRQSAPGIEVENANFSVPEIADLRARLTTLTGLSEFSTITFTLVGLGEPRQVLAGVVDGPYFEVMGLRPVLGRLLGPADDGPGATGALVLTHGFWTSSLGADPTVIGRTVRLGARTATVVGVLQPAVSYPTETEIIANIVTSPHHLSATMVTDRAHRMTELFGRLAPGATLEEARADVEAAHAALMAAYPASYAPAARFRATTVKLRDQITARARTVLFVLMAASGLIFVIACANVANLMLARTIRRESELSVRAALGASPATLRRVLLAECLLVSGAGAIVGVLLAGPSVRWIAHYAERFTVRAHDLAVDASVLWMAAALSIVSAVLIAFIPRLPAHDSLHGVTAASACRGRTTSRMTGRQRLLAVAQVAASFVLLVGAGLLGRSLLALQARDPGFITSQVLAVNVPVTTYGRSLDEVRDFYAELRGRIGTLPGVSGVAVGSAVPWRDTQGFGPDFQFTVGGRASDPNEGDPRANFRSVSPGYFATLGIPLLNGRDFTDGDRAGTTRVVIISESVARRFFAGREPVGAELRWTDRRTKFIGLSPEPRQIVGVVADVADEGLEPLSQMTVYHPFHQETGGGRLFVHSGDPYALVPLITRVVRELATDQPVERASTLADIRAEVLAPSRLNALVVGGFAAVAAAIAVVGVAGLLAFSVSGRTREFGIRLALGSRPFDVMWGVIREGAVLAALGIGIGGAIALALTGLIAGLLYDLRPSDPPTMALAAAVLTMATVIGAAVPAVRAARVDVVRALRTDA